MRALRRFSARPTAETGIHAPAGHELKPDHHNPGNNSPFRRVSVCGRGRVLLRQLMESRAKPPARLGSGQPQSLDRLIDLDDVMLSTAQRQITNPR